MVRHIIVDLQVPGQVRHAPLLCTSESLLSTFDCCREDNSFASVVGGIRGAGWYDDVTFCFFFFFLPVRQAAILLYISTVKTGDLGRYSALSGSAMF